MKKYAAFVKETLGDELIENELGWAQYRFINENQVYLVNVWVDPDHRREGVASALADMVVEAARFRGAKELVTTIVPSAKTATEAIKAHLGYGMSLHSSTDNLIMLRKDI